MIMYCVYLLTNTKNKYTYLGITNNSKQRLRKHNGEIKGGARYTAAKKGDGEWVYHCKVNNLTKSESLSIERTCKNLRKRGVGKTPLEKRMSILTKVCNERNKEIEYMEKIN